MTMIQTTPTPAGTAPVTEDAVALAELHREAALDASSLSALRQAAADALRELVRLSETAAWGDIDDVEVDRASAVFCELTDAYYAALRRVHGLAGDH